MSPRMDFGCLPTAIGSMPQADPVVAVREVVKYLPKTPGWPQLPRRSHLENQYIQFSEGFPGLDVEDQKLTVRRAAFSAGLEKLYQDYLDKKVDCCPISPSHAAGLHAFFSLSDIEPLLVKGQVIGPVTWGLGVVGEDGRPILYDDELSDAAAKFLHLKAAWQEKALQALCPRTMIFIDEPSLSYLGSAFVSLPRDKVLKLMNEVLAGITCIKGIHCCGNTDWPVLLESNTDVLSFDTYNFAQNFVLYPAEVSAFLRRGGAIAWGIVPNTEKALATETVSSLRDRLDDAIAPFTRKGIRYRDMLEQSMLTPSCALAGLTPELAGRALELLAELSSAVRRRYGL